jgi:hypothetical protein
MKVIQGPVTPGTLAPVAMGSGAEALRGVGVWADEAIMMNIGSLKRLNSENFFFQGNNFDVELLLLKGTEKT